MGITVDKLLNAMATNSTRLVIDKASISGQTIGSYCSLWRATGQPAQGAIPTVAATCNETTLGGVQLPQQALPLRSYLAYLEWACSNSSMTLEMHDRLVHIGGLTGNVNTTQNVGIDLEALLNTNNIDVRIGDADYSDVQWWLEWYTATGSTATVATINAKYSDGSSGNLNNLSLAATRPASHMVNLNGLRPTGVSAFIRGINTITLSVSTNSPGNFGVTATRLRGGVYAPIANAKFSCNWADLPINEIPANACPMLMTLCATTSSGTVRGGGKVAHIDPS